MFCNQSELEKAGGACARHTTKWDLLRFNEQKQFLVSLLNGHSAAVPIGLTCAVVLVQCKAARISQRLAGC
jgi:hypothetical protein